MHRHLSLMASLALLAACAAPAAAPTPTVVVPPPAEPPAPSPAPSAAPSAAPVVSATPAAKPAETECIKPQPQNGQPPPDKRKTADALLKGQSVMLYLDARRAGVVVPEYLAQEGMLVLQVGYALAVPIPDLKVDAKGVSGTLSFRRQPFFIKVPWEAVYAVMGAEDRRGGIWYEDVPEDRRCK